MSYHVEKRDYPNFVVKVEQVDDISNVDGMDCPRCGETLRLAEIGHDEQYTMEGWFERTERFYCDTCGTFADVTKRYEPTVRVVELYQDVFDD